jgi:serine/threonine protein kinase
MQPMESGTVLDGRYRMLKRLGAGGMGVVWSAHDKRLNRDVAVKLLSGADEHDHRADELARRFEREAQVAARLSSPHIVTVHDSGQMRMDGKTVLYLVMELLQGRPLNTHLAAGPLELSEVSSWGRQICAGLAAAHAEKVVHRDIKPANIMVGPQGNVTLLDFGIARILEDTSYGGAITRTGAAIGTLGYMSPEQALGRHIDERSDLYSLGCVLYAMVTGRPPFPSGAWHVVLEQHRSKRPEPPSRNRRDLPREWDDLILSLLAKKPEERPQSAETVAALLNKPTMAPPQSSTVPSPGTEGEDDGTGITTFPAPPDKEVPDEESPAAQVPDGPGHTQEQPRRERTKLRRFTDPQKYTAALTNSLEGWPIQLAASLAVLVGVALMGRIEWVNGGHQASTLGLGFALGIVSFFVFWPFASFVPERRHPGSGGDYPIALTVLLGVAALLYIVIGGVHVQTADPARNSAGQSTTEIEWIILFIVMGIPAAVCAAVCLFLSAAGGGFAVPSLAPLPDGGYPKRPEVARVMLLGGWITGMAATRQVMLEYHDEGGWSLLLVYPAWILATGWTVSATLVGLYATRVVRTLVYHPQGK